MAILRLWRRASAGRRRGTPAVRVKPIRTGGRREAQSGSRISYANVVATLALFAALGGSSYAAVLITGSNVKDSSLTTRDIKNGSLLKQDFRAGQLPRGPAGANGTNGAPGVSGYEIVTSDPIPAPNNTTSIGSMNCSAGKTVLGGGVVVSGGTGQTVNDSYPPNTTSWHADVNNVTGAAQTFKVYAICGVVQ